MQAGIRARRTDAGSQPERGQIRTGTGSLQTTAGSPVRFLGQDYNSLAENWFGTKGGVQTVVLRAGRNQGQFPQS
jgi:hypothetical protein